jgi:uncharacterized cupin superfamily protein
MKDIPVKSGTRYPAPFDAPCKAREWQALGDAFGLTQFGVNRVRLKPGVWSSQRHWHTHEDEFVYVLEGAPTLATDDGRRTLGPGDFVGFRGGVENGHHLVNETEEDVVFLVVGARIAEDAVHYPDIDLYWPPGRQEGAVFTRKNGEPY